jgi:hypothetical protein
MQLLCSDSHIRRRAIGRSNYLFDCLYTAHSAARAAGEVALALQERRKSISCNPDVDLRAVLYYFHRQRSDFIRRSDILRRGESDRQILKIRRRRHHYNLRDTVEDESDGRFLGNTIDYALAERSAHTQHADFTTGLKHA